MKIDKHTKYKDFAMFERFVSDDDDKRLKEAAVRDVFGPDGFYNMKLGDMFAVLSGDTSSLNVDGTVFGTYRVKAFADFIDGFIASLKRLTLPATADQVKHSQGCLPTAFDESVYVFCLHYFGLHGFAEVETLKVADLLLAKKDTYNQAVVDRNIAAAMKKGGKA